MLFGKRFQDIIFTHKNAQYPTEINLYIKKNFVQAVTQFHIAQMSVTSNLTKKT